MSTIKINDFALQSEPPQSFFGVGGGEYVVGEWIFRCTVHEHCEDADADLWSHEFIAEIYQFSRTGYVKKDERVWTKEAVTYFAGAQALDLHTALRPFLFDCVVDALLAGHHIVGSYRYDGREWNLHTVETPDSFDLPDLTT